MSPFGLARTCVFVKQLPGPILCGLRALRCSPQAPRHPFSRSYGVNLPSSLTGVLPSALGSSPRLPVSVCGTGIRHLARGFSRQCGRGHFGTLISLGVASRDCCGGFAYHNSLPAYTHSTNGALRLPPCVTPSLKRWLDDNGILTVRPSPTLYASA